MNNYSVKAPYSYKNPKNLRKKFCEFPHRNFNLVDLTRWFDFRLKQTSGNGWVAQKIGT